MTFQERANNLTNLHKKDATQGVPTLLRELRYPIDATVDGHPVRLSFLANVTGYSTCYLATDENQITTWVGISDIKITDRNYMPVTTSQLTTSQR